MDEIFLSRRNILREEEGGVGRRALLGIFFTGLLGGVGYLTYRLRQTPGFVDIWDLADTSERYSLVASAAKGAPPPPALLEKIQNEKNFKARYDAFEKKLGRIRAENKDFPLAEIQLAKDTFDERKANFYFKHLQTYLKSIYQGFRRKDTIPTDLLAEKIDGFAEDRSFALICCCCGLPDGGSFDYMAYSLFTTGYAKRTDKNGERAEYFLDVIHSIAYLRSNWYANLLDSSTMNPRKNGALELVWNFLNAHDLPQDIIRNRTYFEDSLV